MFDSLQPRGLYSPWNSQARILEQVAIPFTKDWTQVSCTAGGFFTSCATREAQEHWSGWSIPFPAELPNPGIELGLLHHSQILYQLSDQGSSDIIVTWVQILAGVSVS